MPTYVIPSASTGLPQVLTSGLSKLASAFIPDPEAAAKSRLFRSQQANLEAEGKKTGLETDLLGIKKSALEGLPANVGFVDNASGVRTLDPAKASALVTNFIRAGLGSNSLNDVQGAMNEDAIARRGSTLKIAERAAEPSTLAEEQGATYAGLPQASKLAALFDPVNIPAGTDNVHVPGDPRYPGGAPAVPAPTPTTAFTKGAGAGGPDEMQDTNTNAGRSATGQNLVRGIAAVNPDVYPIGTVFHDPQTDEIFIAGDVHGNKNPNVIDLYTDPDAAAYHAEQAKSGQRHLQVVGSVKQVGSTPEEVQAQIQHIRENLKSGAPEAPVSSGQAPATSPLAQTILRGAVNDSTYRTPPKADKVISVRSQSMQKAIAENASSLAQIDNAIKAINDNPGAFGLQNTLGPQVRQRLPIVGAKAPDATHPLGSDPNGDTLANVMGIAALKRHSLYGGALTPTETALAQEFIPSSTDTPATALAKLTKIREQYLLDQSALQGGLKHVAALDASGQNADTVVPGVDDIPRLTAANADAEFAALPSGSKFIAPDGTTRTKP